MAGFVPLEQCRTTSKLCAHSPPTSYLGPSDSFLFHLFFLPRKSILSAIPFFLSNGFRFVLFSWLETITAITFDF